MKAATSQSRPTGHDLAGMLGVASALWTQINSDLAAAFGPLDDKWSYTKKTARWSVQLKQRKTKRTVVYLVPLDGHFEAAFALGEKACAAARGSALPAAILELIEGAPRYVEGRAVRLAVHEKQDVENVMRIAGIKMAN